MKLRCYCRCHTPPDLAAVDVSPDDTQTYRLHGVVAVETNDPLEAAVACDVCRKHHCRALLTPKESKPGRATRAELETSLGQFRGSDWKDGGEGPE